MDGYVADVTVATPLPGLTPPGALGLMLLPSTMGVASLWALNPR